MPLQSLLDDLVGKPLHSGATLSVYRASDGFEFAGGAGDLDPDTPYFVASVTKIYLTALCLQLLEEGRLELDDPLSEHLDESDWRGLHQRRGVDRSDQITVRHLLTHTSGLPDYFQQKHDGRSLLARIQSGEDCEWSFEQVLLWSREMRARFPPGHRQRAYYSDTNFQLLGKILENRDERPLAEILASRIFEPLGLEQTWLYVDPSDRRPAAIRFRQQALDIRKAMTSFRGDGSIVSTARDSMCFARAFFEGRLFSAERLPNLYTWRRIFFPFQYGVGVMRIALPRLFSPFAPLPRPIGHSGLSGAFAFYDPQQQVYVTGTVNQLARPDTSVRLITKILTADW